MRAACTGYLLTNDAASGKIAHCISVAAGKRADNLLAMLAEQRRRALKHTRCGGKSYQQAALGHPLAIRMMKVGEHCGRNQLGIVKQIDRPIHRDGRHARIVKQRKCLRAVARREDAFEACRYRTAGVLATRRRHA